MTVERWSEISLLSKPATATWSIQLFLEIFPFGFGDTTYAAGVLSPFLFLLSIDSFYLPVSVSVHLWSCSQVVFSWYILSLALSFTPITLTIASKRADFRLYLSHSKLLSSLLFTFSTLNCTFQKLNKYLAPSPTHTCTKSLVTLVSHVGTNITLDLWRNFKDIFWYLSSCVNGKSWSNLNKVKGFSVHKTISQRG